MFATHTTFALCLLFRNFQVGVWVAVTELGGNPKGRPVRFSIS